MATIQTNDKIQEKLALRYPTEGKNIGDLLARYRAGNDIFLNVPGQIQTLNGNGDWLFTTTKANQQIAGRIWVAVDLTLADWTPAAINTFMSKWEILFNLRSWLFQINTAGNLLWSASPDGALARLFTSTAIVGAADGTRKAVGVDYQPNDGGGNRTATFFTATSIAAADWVQLGAVVSQAGAEGIANQSTNYLIGGDGNIGNTNRLTNAKVYAAEVKAGGIGGTAVANPNFDRASEVGNVYVEDGAGNLWLPSPPVAASSTLRSGAISAWTPDTADLFNVDLDIRVKVTMTDWTPSGTTWIVNQGAHTDVPADLQWVFSLHPNGALRTFLSTDGTLTGAGPESPILGFVDGSTHFLRCTVDSNNGANSVFTYFESFDEGNTWVVIGAPINDVIVNPVFNSVAPIELRRLIPAIQTIHKVELRSTIGGPVILKAEFPANKQSHTDLTGRTWRMTNSHSMDIVAAGTPLLPKHEDVVAHVAAASASLNFGDDANAFWDAFVP